MYRIMFFVFSGVQNLENCRFLVLVISYTVRLMMADRRRYNVEWLSRQLAKQQPYGI